MTKDFYIKISELDDFQYELYSRNLSESMVVTGCAGSGKSVLALHKAKRILDQKAGTCQVVVYTKALSAYMNKGRTELGLNCNFTYHWNWENRQRCPVTDYIVVDEIQDFTEKEIESFKKAARKGFFFYGDTAQSIYDAKIKGAPTVSVRDVAYKAGLETSRLQFNYRLPIPVAKVTEGYIGDGTSFNPGTYKNTSVEMPRIIKYSSFNEQISAIVRIVKRRSLSDVAVLLPDNNSVKMVYNKLTEAGLNCESKFYEFGESYETLNFSTTNVKIMTFHSAKGLQFETVFIPNCEGNRDFGRKPLYVAMTRTSKNLYVMYTNRLSEFFNNVPISLYKTTEFDLISDI